jgi:hypothetical protein
MLYADFLEDPVTWALLGIGVALAATPARREGGRGVQSVSAATPVAAP